MRRWFIVSAVLVASYVVPATATVASADDGSGCYKDNPPSIIVDR